MNNWLAIIALIPFTPLAWATQAASLQPYEGTPEAPKLVRPDIHGKIHELSHYRGQIVLVNFWASWCPPCVKEMPSLQRLSQRLQKNKVPFKILAINIGEERELMESFLEQVEVKFTVLLDEQSTLVKEWGVYAYPSTFLVDQNGHIRYALFGAIDWDTEETANVIRSLAK
jgi:thiol-disulfide isomerase/thioredoxin